jgi:tRNA modification GTPase
MSIPNAPPTIFALATPPGVGALAVVRVSGPAVPDTITALTGAVPPPARVATLVTLKTSDNTVLDQALLTYFPAPASFTGEDVVELCLHGGRAVVGGVLNALGAHPGLRLAEPGEFTKRAFLNHKLDLTEAEAIADLIHAETAIQRAQALHQLSGSLKKLYDGWRDALIHAAAYIEAHLDFADEDIPDDVIDRVRPRLDALVHDIAAHLNDQGRGETLRDGVRVVIVGAPNAGKSSLLNALARRDVAIVSNIPGTTRDTIDVHLDLNGYPVILTDTAGLRDVSHDAASDPHAAIEQLGIDRARARARTADIKIALFDGTVPVDPATTAQIDDTTVVVVNKTDLIGPGGGTFPDLTAFAPVSMSAARWPSGLARMTGRLSPVPATVRR